MNADKKTKTTFANALASLLSCYPSVWVGTKTDQSRRVKEWHEQLRRYPLDTVLEALSDMPRSYPDAMPTIGQIAARCRSFDDAKRADIEQQERSRREGEEEASHLRRLGRIPDSDARQQEWIDAGATPCDRIERKWLVESARRRAAGEKCPTMPISRMVSELCEAIDTTTKPPTDRQYFPREREREPGEDG